MKVTKYEHSCLDIHEGNNRLVIDPGRFSPSFNNFSGIDTLVLTHVHRDHFDQENVAKIITQNPGVQIFTTSQVAEQITNTKPIVPEIGKTYSAGVFVLEFFGGKHELYDDFENIAVLVNNKLFHPGDSYSTPEKPVEALAAPASAPWLRVSEASDFIAAIKARTVFPIHNALLSEIGESVHYRILGEAAASAGSKWQVLKPGESIEI